MSSSRIARDVILVTSGGRTGTSFLGERLGDVIEDCWSVHEPDVWRGARDSASWRAVRWFGPYHVLVGKLLRRTGMRCLVERRLAGDWSDDRVVEAMIRQRKRFYESRSASLVVESNWQWYGLLSLLPRVFDSYRVLAIVRDPRSWVRSWMNFGGHHDETDQVTALGLPRVSPALLGEDPEDGWKRMDVFQRLCWDWRHVTGRLLEGADADFRVRLIRFEDLFLGSERRRHFDEALDFVTNFGARRYPVAVPPGFLDRKVNESRPRRVGPWRRWSKDRRRYLADMCGELMERLGYSLADDPETGGDPDA